MKNWKYRTINAVMIVAMLLGLVAYSPSVSAQTQPPSALSAYAANGTVVCDYQQNRCWRGIHEDVIARFSSGRTIRAFAAVEEDLSTGRVRAWLLVFATGLRKNVVPGSYTLKGFHFEAYSCGYLTCPPPPVTTFTKCTGDGCTIRTTANNPYALFVGSVWRDEAAYDGWRTRGDNLSGVILNTSDSTSNKCVSSYLWQWRDRDESSLIAPSC